MAEIRPFRALRYDSSRVRLEDVLTQPYDKISPAMQEQYYRRSPYNLVRFELAKPEPGAGPQQAYAQSAAFLSDLQAQGILQRDEGPGLYAYAQGFRPPFDPDRQMERLGLIALGRLYDYAEGVVFRHEETLSGPKADRMNLLRSTRTHSGQIFMLYEDPARGIEQIIAEAVAGRTPDACVVDEYAVENRLWRISDAPTIATLVAAFADKKLIIADGHHRYETARAYRDAQRERGATGLQPYDFTMLTLVNMDSAGLVVLPTHRVVFGLERLDWGSVRARLAEWFDLEPASGDPQQLARQLQSEPGNAFVMASISGTYLLRGISAAVARALPSVSAAELKVDVTVLHELVLQGILGLSAADIREQRHVRYFREPEKALGELDHGANAVFLLKPVPLAVLRDVCYAGKVMPQKSTDFYPKLLSGLTLYSLDRSFEKAQPAEIH